MHGAGGDHNDEVLAATPLIDGHNDLPWIIRARFNSSLTAVDLASDTSWLKPPADQAPMMTDLPRMHAGQVGAQFWSVYVPVEMQGPVAVQVRLLGADGELSCLDYEIEI